MTHRALLVGIEEHVHWGWQVIGIDLGTTNSCVAIMEGGKAKVIEKMWADRGGSFKRPVETNMVWLDLPHSGITVDEVISAGKEEGVKLMSGRIIVHHQISDEAIVRLEKVFDRLLSSKEKKNGEVQEAQTVYRSNSVRLLDGCFAKPASSLPATELCTQETGSTLLPNDSSWVSQTS